MTLDGGRCDADLSVSQVIAQQVVPNDRRFCPIPSTIHCQNVDPEGSPKDRQATDSPRPYRMKGLPRTTLLVRHPSCRERIPQGYLWIREIGGKWLVDSSAPVDRLTSKCWRVNLAQEGPPKDSRAGRGKRTFSVTPFSSTSWTPNFRTENFGRLLYQP
jgi:hypothetical protein